MFQTPQGVGDKRTMLNQNTAPKKKEEIGYIRLGDWDLDTKLEPTSRPFNYIYNRLSTQIKALQDSDKKFDHNVAFLLRCEGRYGMLAHARSISGAIVYGAEMIEGNQGLPVVHPQPHDKSGKSGTGLDKANSGAPPDKAQSGTPPDKAKKTDQATDKTGKPGGHPPGKPGGHPPGKPGGHPPGKPGGPPLGSTGSHPGNGGKPNPTHGKVGDGGSHPPDKPYRIPRNGPGQAPAGPSIGQVLHLPPQQSLTYGDFKRRDQGVHESSNHGAQGNYGQFPNQYNPINQYGSQQRLEPSVYPFGPPQQSLNSSYPTGHFDYNILASAILQQQQGGTGGPPYGKKKKRRKPKKPSEQQ